MRPDVNAKEQQLSLKDLVFEEIDRRPTATPRQIGEFVAARLSQSHIDEIVGRYIPTLVRQLQTSRRNYAFGAATDESGDVTWTPETLAQRMTISEGAIKRLGDCTVSDLRRLVLSYRQRAFEMSRRADQLAGLADQLERSGSHTVSEMMGPDHAAVA